MRYINTYLLLLLLLLLLLCQQFGLFMAWITLKIPFWMALEGHGMFVENINKPWWAKFFSTDFDYWVTEVNNGIGMEVMQEGR